MTPTDSYWRDTISATMAKRYERTPWEAFVAWLKGKP